MRVALGRSLVLGLASGLALGCAAVGDADDLGGSSAGGASAHHAGGAAGELPPSFGGLGGQPPKPGSDCDVECLFPVADHVDLDYVVWCEEGVHLYIPRPTWAMAAIHASRIMAHYTGDIRTTVSPNWFIATALKESYFGCDPALPADRRHPERRFAPQPSSYGDGCFQVRSEAIAELSQVFPAHVPNSHPAVVSNAAFETSALAMALYNAFGMVRACAYTGGRSAREVLSQMADPLGQLKVFVIGYNQGLWNDAEFGRAIKDCANAPELLACVFADAAPGYDYAKAERVNCPGGTWLQTSEALPYAHAIGHYVEQLDEASRAGHCYDETFTAADVEAYVSAISLLFPALKRPAAGVAIRMAFDAVAGGAESVGFQRGFPRVLEVIERLQGELQDPWPGMVARFGVDNPKQCDVLTPYLPSIEDTCHSVPPPPR